MYFSKDTDGAITLNFGNATAAMQSKMIIGRDGDGYIVLNYEDGQITPGEFPNYGRDYAGQRIITCTNADGQSMILTEQRLDPFVLCKAEGIYTTQNDLVIKSNAMIDGGTYFGSTMTVRNIVLTIKDIEGHDANREFVDMVFDKNKPGILEVQDGAHVRAIEYYVESVETTATPVTRVTTISLQCPDPYFYDPAYTNIYIANLVPKFEFIHEFNEYGEEIGMFNDNRIGTIDNETADDGIGLIMTIKASGHVENPVVTLIETQESIALGTENRPFVLEYGESVIINTNTGKKNVYSVDGNSQNTYLTGDSVFFQIRRGTNSIGYTADVGDDNMSITVMYRYRYVRA